MTHVSSEEDDFEESLVRAVVVENPPQEQGIRSEWENHIGWNRKEYVHLRGAGSPEESNLNDVNSKIKKDGEGNGESRNTRLIPSNMAFRWLVSIVVVGSVVLTFLRVNRTKRKQRHQ